MSFRRTHFATKVSTNFMPIVQNQFAIPALDVTANSVGHVPAGAVFSQALFRFLNIPSTYAVYAGGVTSIDNIMRGSSFSSADVPNVPFYASRYGSRYPREGPSAKLNVALAVNPGAGISENHRDGTDTYVGLWSGSDTSNNNYVYSDSAASRGTKCVAGICLENEPVLYMYR
jgi:hypothetical protein